MRVLPAISHVLRDRQFWLAILAAVGFWILLGLFKPVTPDSLWPLHQPLMFLQVVLLYPVLEEYVFRGLLQGYLREKNWGGRAWFGITLANALTSLVFTALHFFYHPPLAAAAVLLPSLIFGYFRDRHSGLAAPIMLHAYYNLGYFWLFAS